MFDFETDRRAAVPAAESIEVGLAGKASTIPMLVLRLLCICAASCSLLASAEAGHSLSKYSSFGNPFRKGLHEGNSSVSDPTAAAADSKAPESTPEPAYIAAEQPASATATESKAPESYTADASVEEAANAPVPTPEPAHIAAEQPASETATDPNAPEAANAPPGTTVARDTPSAAADDEQPTRTTSTPADDEQTLNTSSSPSSPSPFSSSSLLFFDNDATAQYLLHLQSIQRELNEGYNTALYNSSIRRRVSLKRTVSQSHCPRPHGYKQQQSDQTELVTRVDVTPLNRLLQLEISPVDKQVYATVGAGMSMFELVEALLPLGYIPAIVPEFKVCLCVQIQHSSHRIPVYTYLRFISCTLSIYLSPLLSCRASLSGVPSRD
jgi:hypothetical protein